MHACRGETPDVVLNTRSNGRAGALEYVIVNVLLASASVAVAQSDGIGAPTVAEAVAGAVMAGWAFPAAPAPSASAQSAPNRSVLSNFCPGHSEPKHVA